MTDLTKQELEFVKQIFIVILNEYREANGFVNWLSLIKNKEALRKYLAEKLPSIFASKNVSSAFLVQKIIGDEQNCSNFIDDYLKNCPENPRAKVIQYERSNARKFGEVLTRQLAEQSNEFKQSLPEGLLDISDDKFMGAIQHAQVQILKQEITKQVQFRNGLSNSLVCISATSSMKKEWQVEGVSKRDKKAVVKLNVQYFVYVISDGINYYASAKDHHGLEKISQAEAIELKKLLARYNPNNAKKAEEFARLTGRNSVLTAQMQTSYEWEYTYFSGYKAIFDVQDLQINLKSKSLAVNPTSSKQLFSKEKTANTAVKTKFFERRTLSDINNELFEETKELKVSKLKSEIALLETEKLSKNDELTKLLKAKEQFETDKQLERQKNEDASKAFEKVTQVLSETYAEPGGVYLESVDDKFIASILKLRKIMIGFGENVFDQVNEKNVPRLKKSLPVLPKKDFSDIGFNIEKHPGYGEKFLKCDFSDAAKRPAFLSYLNETRQIYLKLKAWLQANKVSGLVKGVHLISHWFAKFYNGTGFRNDEIVLYKNIEKIVADLGRFFNLHNQYYYPIEKKGYFLSEANQELQQSTQRLAEFEKNIKNTENRIDNVKKQIERNEKMIAEKKQQLDVLQNSIDYIYQSPVDSPNPHPVLRRSYSS